jgi:hypothetical protein
MRGKGRGRYRRGREALKCVVVVVGCQPQLIEVLQHVIRLAASRAFCTAGSSKPMSTALRRPATVIVPHPGERGATLSSPRGAWCHIGAPRSAGWGDFVWPFA